MHKHIDANMCIVSIFIFVQICYNASRVETHGHGCRLCRDGSKAIPPSTRRSIKGMVYDHTRAALHTLRKAQQPLKLAIERLRRNRKGVKVINGLFDYATETEEINSQLHDVREAFQIVYMNMYREFSHAMSANPPRAGVFAAQMPCFLAGLRVCFDYTDYIGKRVDNLQSVLYAAARAEKAIAG